MAKDRSRRHRRRNLSGDTREEYEVTHEETSYEEVFSEEVRHLADDVRRHEDDVLVERAWDEVSRTTERTTERVTDGLAGAEQTIRQSANKPAAKTVRRVRDAASESMHSAWTPRAGMTLERSNYWRGVGINTNRAVFHAGRWMRLLDVWKAAAVLGIAGVILTIWLLLGLLRDHGSTELLAATDDETAVISSLAETPPVVTPIVEMPPPQAEPRWAPVQSGSKPRFNLAFVRTHDDGRPATQLLVDSLTMAPSQLPPVRTLTRPDGWSVASGLSSAALPSRPVRSYVDFPGVRVPWNELTPAPSPLAFVDGLPGSESPTFGFAVDADWPATSAPGETVRATIRVKNLGDTARHVRVLQTAAPLDRVVATEPPAAVSDDRLIWTVTNWPAGQLREFDIEFLTDNRRLSGRTEVVATTSAAASFEYADRPAEPVEDVAPWSPSSQELAAQPEPAFEPAPDFQLQFEPEPEPAFEPAPASWEPATPVATQEPPKVEQPPVDLWTPEPFTPAEPMPNAIAAQSPDAIDLEPPEEPMISEPEPFDLFRPEPMREPAAMPEPFAPARGSIARAALKFTVRLPSQPRVGKALPVVFEVHNDGAADATDVRLQVTLPEMLDYSRGRELELEIGGIKAGETYRTRMTTTAKAVGTERIESVVMADNADRASALTPVTVNKQISLATAAPGRPGSTCSCEQ